MRRVRWHTKEGHVVRGVPSARRGPGRPPSLVVRKRANRFKLCSFAFPGRGGAGCLYRNSSSERRGGVCLYRVFGKNVWEASFYREKWLGDTWEPFFYRVGGVPAFGRRLFIESLAVQRSGTVFL